MPGAAEVSGPSPAADRTLRVRPPSPLSTGRRVAIGVGAALALVVAAVLVLQARSSDGDQAPGARWNRRPPPRAAKVDGFDTAGSLGTVADFGTWSKTGPALRATDGVLGQTVEAAMSATVDAGSSDVAVYAQFIAAPEGTGLLLAADPTGFSGIWVVATGPDRWEARAVDAPGSFTTVGEVQAPTTEVIVQASLRDGELKVLVHPASGATKTLDVEVPADTVAGTSVGITTLAPGAALDLFGYLALDAA